MIERVGIRFCRLERANLPLLARWQGQPHVARWWGPAPDLAALEKEHGPGIDGEDPTQVFMTELEGTPVGLIQRYRNRDHPHWDQQIQVPDAASIDYYIGEPDLIGRGLGPTIIAAFVEQLFVDYVDVVCVTVGVLQENRPSWRALEKAGFVRLRSQHLESDEPWDRGPGYVYVIERSRGGGPSPGAANMRA
jgi:aminoglycoside 6'-N-acetyltransferase